MCKSWLVHLLPHQSGDQTGTPDIFALSPVTTASIRAWQAQGQIQLSHFLPFLHSKDKLSTNGLKEGPGQKLFPLPFYLVYKFPFQNKRPLWGKEED